MAVLSIFHWNQVLIGDSTVSNIEPQTIGNFAKKEKKNRKQEKQKEGKYADTDKKEKRNLKSI